MFRLLLIVLVFITNPVFAQTEITWKTLQDVEFTDKYSEEEEAYYYYPHFGTDIKAIEGKDVYLRGYMLPLDPSEDFFILSQNPNASCFFCGSGGPESIVQIKFKRNHPKFRMDQVVTIRGLLTLNHDDIYTCNYVLEHAEVYDK